MSHKLVIIPTYNEIENIEKVLRNIFSQSVDFDILVVDDSSPDKTWALVQELQEEFKNRLHLEIRKSKSGLGKAYLHGFRWALERSYDYIFEMDADFSHNPNDLIRLYNTCVKDDFDMSIGSRYIKGVNVVNWPMKRVLLSWLASKYVKIITGLPIEDTTAGFICYHRKVLEDIDLNKIKFVGYAFQIEMKFKAYKKGFKIKEIPVIFTDRTKGKSKMNTGIIKEAVFGVMSLKLKSLLGKI
ncbi:polyprenol monophosphomannose synthase [Psychroflexus gondwanensis]|jgi:dolichol-phosphate mannosyltransferase|uniref:Dolichol-phosphate mannosyltransferase n=1 Tax=Psychroflexus gondwanensis ACAM 44 TaxID=1189619 RepID=N1WLG1_9FLAO|nr:polyprenol monophosphomannose synthase [Psychroflexus gondwanensis]EMY81136.1 dolichol-phosphate mannosyltransferase [Psychroflexus gondwanensis ACAM 44]TXE20661.1 polyprenol monophosphomannose synthase [Psychroflexus gondwanensis]